MNSGIYLLTLNNETPMLIDLDKRRRVIKVTRANCKVGETKDLAAREKTYHRIFGKQNCNFRVLLRTPDYKAVEKNILGKLKDYRMRSVFNKSLEWLEGISGDEVMQCIGGELK